METVGLPSLEALYQDHVNPQWVRLLRLLQMNVRYVRCTGTELFTEDGKRILDFLSGYCVHNAGHNHPAIIAALKEGRLAYAGFDVYDKEPLPIDHPLRTAPNVILTPHIGYVTEENYRNSYPQIVENVVAFLDGKPIRVI